MEKLSEHTLTDKGIRVIARKLGLLALGIVTPYTVWFLVEMTATNGPAGFARASPLLVGCLFLWLMMRPGYTAISVTFLWIALFFGLAPFGIDTHAPANVTYAEKGFYFACLPQISIAAFILGILTASVATMRSLRLQYAPK